MNESVDENLVLEGLDMMIEEIDRSGDDVEEAKNLFGNLKAKVQNEEDTQVVK